jgi:hypothetical protein
MREAGGRRQEIGIKKQFVKSPASCLLPPASCLLHPSSLSSMRESNLFRMESGGGISRTLNPIAVTIDSKSARISPAPLSLSLKSASNARVSRSFKAPSAKSAASACISSCLSFGSNGAHLRDRRQEAGDRRQEDVINPASCFLPPASWL